MLLFLTMACPPTAIPTNYVTGRFSFPSPSFPPLPLLLSRPPPNLLSLPTRRRRKQRPSSTFLLRLTPPKAASSVNNGFPFGEFREYGGRERSDDAGFLDRLRAVIALVRSVLLPGGSWWRLEEEEEEAVDGKGGEEGRRGKKRSKAVSVVSVLRRMWELVVKDRWIIFLAFSSLIFAALSDISIPHFLAASIFSSQSGESMVFYRNIKVLVLLCFSSGICSGKKRWPVRKILLGLYAREAAEGKPRGYMFCSFCNLEVKGGINRLKHHLGGTHKDIRPCNKVPQNVKDKCLNALESLKKDKVVREELTRNIGAAKSKEDLLREGEEISEYEFESGQGSNTGTPRSSGPMDRFMAPEPRQTTIENRFKKEQRIEICRLFGRFFYAHALPFNLINSPYLKELVAAIGVFGHGLKVPSMYEMRTWILKKEVEHTEELMKDHKKSWETYGCSIMSDGWTDSKSRSIINFLVNSPEGTVFLKSVDASHAIKSASFLFQLLDDVVEEVGEKNVVQVVTDNAANYVAAGKLLMEKRRHIFWTPCAAHCIDLILEDIGKMKIFTDVIEKAKGVTNFIYGHGWVLKLMRKYTNDKELLRPAVTRFATCFLTLQSLYRQQQPLIAMFSSEEFCMSSWAKKPAGIKSRSTVLFTKTFWSRVGFCVRMAMPLVCVLREVDSDVRPSMGFLYEAMDTAKEKIAAASNNKKRQYKPFWDIIDNRWTNQLHSPLHAAGYYLNPKYFYGENFVADREVKVGLHKCIDRMLSGEERENADIELDDYRDKKHSFGIDLAMSTINKRSPVGWWMRFGTDAPSLRKFAIRVLGLTCSASGCERNWSTFEQVRRLREMLYSVLLFQDISFFDEETVGDLTSRLGSDCQQVSSVIGNDLNLISRYVLQGTGALIYLLILSWPLALSTVLICSVLSTIMLFYGQYQKRAAKLTQDFTACANEVAQETFSLVRTIRVYGTEKQEVGRYMKWLEKLTDIILRQSLAYGFWNLSFNSLYHSTQVIAVLIGGISIMSGHLSAEQLTKFILYTEWLIYSTWRVGDNWSSLMQSIGASEKVFQLMDLLPSKQFLSAGLKLQKLIGQIEFVNVSFHYPSRIAVPALQHVNLSVHPNEVVAIVGLSGSGKSTLVNLLLRLYDPTDGQILLDGVPLGQLDIKWLREKIGFVGQEPRLFRMDVSSNIRYGCPREVNHEDVEWAAKQAFAHEFILSLPKGYGTLVDNALLSGGQKQRIAIARAILRDPTILILDEATSALDAESEHYVKGILRAVQRESKAKRTVIVIAHRLSTIRAADRIVVMDSGGIVEMGDHMELMQKDGLYTRLTKRQTDALA